MNRVSVHLQAAFSKHVLKRSVAGWLGWLGWLGWFLTVAHCGLSSREKSRFHDWEPSLNHLQCWAELAQASNTDPLTSKSLHQQLWHEQKKLDLKAAFCANSGFLNF